MIWGNYTVTVEGGEELPGGYVRMPHGGTFTLYLANDTNRRCDAHVVIDGRPVGTWPLATYSSTIARGPLTGTAEVPQQPFTFYQPGSPEAFAAGLPTDERAGLISVTFTPETPTPVAAELTPDARTEPVTVYLRLVAESAVPALAPAPVLTGGYAPAAYSAAGLEAPQRKPVPRWKLVARDTGIVWLATLLVGFVIGFSAAVGGRSAGTGDIAIGNIVAMLLSGILIGCLVRRNRFSHLLLVATMTWLTSVVNIPFTGISVVQWLFFTPLFIFPTLLLGGLVSLLFARESTS